MLSQRSLGLLVRACNRTNRAQSQHTITACDYGHQLNWQVPAVGLARHTAYTAHVVTEITGIAGRA
eukprot:1160474-Pelagomonas_calceolata.AAC.5